MVPSMAIPTAMTATMAVPGFNGILNNPMIPNIIAIGITAGTMAIAPPLNEVNMADMMRKIRPSRINNASTCPTINFSAARFTIRFSPITWLEISGPAIPATTSRSSLTYRFSVCESLMLWRTMILALR